jgi:hypothetical protein
MSKISIPQKAKELLNLGDRVHQKHQEDATTSVLSGLEWNSVGPTIQTGIDPARKGKEVRA